MNERTHPTLASILLSDDHKPQTIEDCVALVKKEVALKKGPSGFVVKIAYRAALSVSPTIVHDLVSGLIDDFVETCEPWYAQYLASGRKNIRTAISDDADVVTDMILNYTDTRAASSKQRILKAAYTRARAHARPHVRAAIPTIGQFLQDHGC